MTAMKGRERPKGNTDLCWVGEKDACRGQCRAARNPGEESLCAKRRKKFWGGGGRECRFGIIKSKMWIIANMCVGSKATYHHHHYPTRLPVLQQSRNFVIVGEVKVAIETDACYPSLLLLPPHPLLLTFSPWAVSSQHISQQFLPTVYVCSDYVKHAQSTTHSFSLSLTPSLSEAVDHISPSLKYSVTVQLP